MKVLLEGFKGRSLEIAGSILGIGVCVGGSVGNWLGLVIEPSGLSLMLRCSKGSIMEVVAVAERDSAIGEEEEDDCWWWAENSVVGFEEDGGGVSECHVIMRQWLSPPLRLCCS